MLTSLLGKHFGDLHEDSPRKLSGRCFAWQSSSDAESRVLKFGRTPTERCLLRAEAEALEQFDHPSIPCLIAYEERPEFAMLSMSAAPGISLATILKCRSVPVPGWDRSIRDAIGYIHSKGMNHGDIKPQNIVVHGDEASLVDFGSVLPHGTRYNATRWRSYSPSFAAWGQVAGRGTAGPEDDLFSLACTEFVAKYGRHPLNSYRLTEFLSRGMPCLDELISSCGRPLAYRLVEQYQKAEQIGETNPPS